MNTSSLQKLPVVHSSFGRVRVHLPDPDGFIAARVRRRPGVTYAQASMWTENILVLFVPTMASEEDVIAELLLAAECGPEVMDELSGLPTEFEPRSSSQTASEQPAGYVTGLRRTVYEALGWVSVGLAVVGFIVPGIPGAPFVVLAGYFFIRSSPKSHAWLLRSRWFGPILRDWEEQRGVRRSLKWTAIALIAVAMVVILLSGLPPVLIAAILVCEVIGMIIVLRLRVVEPRPAQLPMLTAVG
jgi:uncharacterized membrane protein YbaN (DUF454 family)